MFNSIYFNGNEYKEMWLNGNKIWEKDNGGSGDYSDADCVITYYNESKSAVTKEFEPIDIMLPYSINGTRTTTFSFPSKVETQVKLVNLKPTTGTGTTFYPVNYEKLYLPYLTDLSYLFAFFCRDTSRTYSWSPQNFTFSNNVTNMSNMFYYAYNLTDEMVEQILPYLPNTSNVTTMANMFEGCMKLKSLNLSSWDISRVTSLKNMFYYCLDLETLDVSTWNTRAVTSYSSMFTLVEDATIYIGNGWTLETSANLGGGSDNTFINVDAVYGDIVVSTSNLYVTEGTTSSSLGVKLSQSPTNAQTVTYTYTSDRVATWSNTFTFDSTNWNTYQYVAFTPALDRLYTDRTDTITFTSDNVENVSVSVFVTNTEQENTGGGDTGNFPYSDADTVITFRNTSSSAVDKTIGIINYSNPYSINGTKTTSFSFPASSETQVKLVNLKPDLSADTTFFPVKIEQLRIPNLTNIKYTFSYFGYSSSYEYSWSPQYFEFSSEITDMSYMFYNCLYLTDELMAQFMPYFPNTSQVTNMYRMFYQCKTLTKLDLSHFDTSNVTSMSYLFRYCGALKELDLSSWNTSKVTSYSYMFNGVSNCTIYIGDGWTLGTESTFAGGTNLTFVKGSSGEDSGSGDSGTTTNSLLVDWTQSTAPTLPNYMTVDYNGTYSFSHGLYTTDVYGLIPSNKGKKSSTAYTRYKYVAPKSGNLTFTYRCSAETNYDYLTVHVDTSTSQPSTTSGTNQVFTTKRINSYQNTDGTASVSVVEGTTYYIHIQYYKDVSGDSGYDMGCIRTIELK